MEKRYRLTDLRIFPQRETDDGTVPVHISYSYVTEVVEDGIVIASSKPHSGTAPTDDRDAFVHISSDGTTKSVGQILSEVGLP